ncbi:MAG: aminotransferase class III-fold pyridoxal phosphate-dependent enzyme [Rubrivivax sp.]
MALAGGASITCPPNSGYLFQDGAMLSPDGRTRSFDAEAQGTVFSDGAAVVLLKRLSDALADGDTVHAVIRGAAVNNDGRDKASFTAPSVDGQAAVIAAAHAAAGIDPRSVSYVETHGTATPLGDPVEIEALTQAFRQGTADIGFCRVGSLKSNVGHTVIAAGAAGVIKTALALAEQKLPPSIHYERPNPKIDFATSPFVVCDSLTEWPRGAEARRAGVSSFGVGGTNAHVVMEEAPLQAPSSAAVGPQLLLLGARSAAALERMAAQLADAFEAAPGLNLADAAHTLQVGRSRFAHRLAVVAATPAEGAAALRRPDDPWRVGRTVAARVPPLVWLFTGQGAQYARMGSGLRAHDADFREAFDECLDAVAPAMSFDLRAALLDPAADALSATAATQPASFCIEVALARMWLARGAMPAALIGHSVGEFAAAVVAGVMSLRDAARLVAQRGALMQALPAGAMLSLRLPAASVVARLPDGISLACENSPASCVVAGPSAAIAAWQAQLQGEGVVARVLQTSHAFHSSMMDPAVGPFEAEMRRVTLSAPRIEIISTLTGAAMTPEEATDPRYWSRNLREPVRFSAAVTTALSRHEPAFLELGPRGTLATLARQHAQPGKPAPVAIASLADTPGTESSQSLLAQGSLWALGIDLPAPAASPAFERRRIVLPTYSFERTRHWIEAAPAAAVAPRPALPIAAVPTPAAAPVASPPASPVDLPTKAVMSTATTSAAPPAASRRPRFVQRLREVFEDVSGAELGGTDPATAFVELGLDSLTLTQAALQVKKHFGVPLTFRLLMEKYRSFDSLAEFLDASVPPDATAQEAASAPAKMAATTATPPTASATVSGSPSLLQEVIAQQMQLMARQLALLEGASVPAGATAAATPVDAPPIVAATDEASNAPLRYDAKKAFGAIARIHTQGSDVTSRQKVRLETFMRRYIERTAKSKAYTIRHRPGLADPRVVNGFRPMTKEITYQIVVERSLGSRLWDVDGHEYVDVLNGFGMNLFGWQPSFVQEAVRRQLDAGYEIGPQHPLAGEVADLVCELTGFDRAGLCNTGSEAVMAAVRIARTVTGRDMLVLFTGSYHGTFDEVLVRAGRGGKGIPAAPGIMSGVFGDIRVLDYGTPEALEFIRSHADDIAAVLVEPVQSRRPDFQPREFLQEVRAITERSGSCLIFDEVITGFRAHLGGTQALFGIRADLACYGKVIGGGFPIGVVAGKRAYMDALDGGSWDYGDDSMPTVGVTYFAGTFVRHPLALAAARASLEHLKQQGPALQERLTATTAAMADELSAFCREVGAPLEIRHFASLWRVSWHEDHPLQDLLFAMMRSRGVHILDNFPCFMTTAHTPQDIAVIKSAFKESVAELQESDFLPRRISTAAAMFDASRPPTPGARLGRDADGKPAWFVANPDALGKYMKVELQ